MSTSEPTVRDAALQLIRRGCFDPGATVPREFDQGPEKDETEPVWAWCARAVLSNLMNAGLLSEARPAADAEPSPHEAAVVLHHYGAEGGYPASGFVATLLAAMDGADVGNLARFRAGWPGLTQAVDLAKNHRDGIERLQQIAVEPVERTGGQS